MSNDIENHMVIESAEMDPGEAVKEALLKNKIHLQCIDGVDTSDIEAELREEDEFDKCVNVSDYEISCKLGLWSVSSSAGNPEIMNEAYYYWMQYKADGEYNELLEVGESRHETAKRIIRQHENQDNQTSEG